MNKRTNEQMNKRTNDEQTTNKRRINERRTNDEQTTNKRRTNDEQTNKDTNKQMNKRTNEGEKQISFYRKSFNPQLNLQMHHRAAQIKKLF
jgi:hypothetical protein